MLHVIWIPFPCFKQLHTYCTTLGCHVQKEAWRIYENCLKQFITRDPSVIQSSELRWTVSCWANIEIARNTNLASCDTNYQKAHRQYSSIAHKCQGRLLIALTGYGSLMVIGE